MSNFIKKIFSVRNMYFKKVFTILGLEIKIPYKLEEPIVENMDIYTQYYLSPQNISLFGFNIQIPYLQKRRFPKWLLYNIVGNYDDAIMKRNRFEHPIGLVICPVEIGYDNIIYQNVTIGGKHFGCRWPEDFPRLGSNIIIYAGAVIVGGVTVGDNCIIGANTVVTKDVLPDSIVIGNPMQIYSKEEWNHKKAMKNA